MIYLVEDTANFTSREEEATGRTIREPGFKEEEKKYVTLEW